VRQVEQLQPDAVLLDISMPLLNGIEAARQIKKIAPKVKLLFVTQKPDREYVRITLGIGASGYVLKQPAASEVVGALREVSAGRFYVSPLLRQGIPEALLNPAQNPSEPFWHDLNAQATAGAAIGCGREVHQGNRRHSAYFSQDGGFSQSGHYGRGGASHHGGVNSLCNGAWNRGWMMPGNSPQKREPDFQKNRVQDVGLLCGSEAFSEALSQTVANIQTSGKYLGVSK
jgi:CheY-like chemotaxis protein